MFGYYLGLAVLSLKRSRALTALMICAIALGIGASMTTLTMLHVLSADPLPGRSDKIFHPAIDPRPLANFKPGEPPGLQISWTDGNNLLRDHRGTRQALMGGGRVAVQPPDAREDPFFAFSRYTTADMFEMFGIRFIQGGGWRASDDDARARVVVITEDLARQLFGTAQAVGRSMRVEDNELKVIGVIEDWKPEPHFYDLNVGSYGRYEQVFLPLTTARALKFGRAGSISCWGGGNIGNDLETQPCEWLQYWVQLDDAAQRDAYRDYLVHYSQEQHRLGRFEREPNVRLDDVAGWLDFNKVVPGDVRLQAWLALSFLVVCLVNTVALMLAKFLRRSGEVGVRRALGASRRDVLVQLLCEAGIIGLAGGVGGLLLTWLGLALVRSQPTAYAKLASLDLPMLGATFALAIVSALAAGLLPAWRACLIAPALQLKID
ncbi:MAG: ABC transporter permease [Luteibacter sp.]